MKLLNPGPVSLTERVRKALMREDMCHREIEFAEMTKDVIARLGAIYPEARDGYVPVLITGSGTAAVEAMIGSIVPRAGRALVVANGVYGERAAAMLDAQGKAHTLVRAEWTAPMKLDDVARELSKGGHSHVIAVHHETTTGRLNDVAALGALCKKHGVPMLLDGVSSFGGEEIRFDDWNLEACAATANKCLHGVPGIAFVLVKKSVFAGDRATGATSVYLDLFRYRKEQTSGFSPFTQSVQAMFALQEALRELDDAGGWTKRHARYRAITSRVIEELRALGVELMLESKDVSSAILTAFKMPGRTTYAKLHDELKEAGFVIYAGQGQFSGSIFRIAVMGDISDGDVDRLVVALRRSLGSGIGFRGCRRRRRSRSCRSMGTAGRRRFSIGTSNRSMRMACARSTSSGTR
jgi:2-aminoethylphosphonate-pyruvate transaminase